MYNAAVITISDKGSVGQREDTAGPAITEILKNNNYNVSYTNIISDDLDGIKKELIKCTDELKLALVITTGGTGFSPRDNTPEATLSVIEKEVRGIPELMRAESYKVTDKAYLSRAVAGIRNRTLIINVPGSKKAAIENTNVFIKSLAHGLDILNGEGSANCGG